MNKFIFKIMLFILPIVIILIIYIIQFGSPPPKLSNSISFNAKILNLKEKKISTKVDILSVGSSMSLNNIHTETMKEYFGPKYLNISSWGQNIEEDFNLIKIFSKHYKPRIIIISSNYMDFHNNSKRIKYNLVNNYLFGNGVLAYKELNLKYFLKESRRYSRMKNDTHNYTSLMYDDFGGINFKKTKFNIDPRRWNGNSIKEFNFDINQYKYLDSITQFCRTKDIDLFLIHSPFRKGYYSKLDEHSLDILHVHKNKIDSILKKYNLKSINTENEVWEDSLFVDYSHFNKEGSEIYTEYFLMKINKARTHN